MNDETKEESLLEWDKIELRRAIAGSCDDIWRYWAEPHLIKRWWGDSVHLELRVGGPFEERWKASDGSEMVTSGTVIICQPSRSFTLTFTLLFPRVTVTMVPNGTSHMAHVRSSGLNGSPEAVGRPLNFSPYQEAIPLIRV